MSFGSLGSDGGRPRLRPGLGLKRRRGAFYVPEPVQPEPGDVIISFDEGTPPHPDAFLLDGSMITDGALDNPEVATRYPWMVSGDDLVLPNGCGRFLRIWDNGRGKDPDAASRTARAGDGQTGDYPGTEQPDQFGSHRHAQTADPYINMVTSGSLDRASNADEYVSDVGGNETRGMNMAFSFWMLGG